MVAGFALVKLFLPGLSRANQYLPIIVGVIAAILHLQWSRPLHPDFWKRAILSRTVTTMLANVALVLVYGSFVNSTLPDGTALVEHMRREMAGWGLPLTAVIACIPFVCGLTTGIAVAFVGASFPIVLSLIGPHPLPRELLSTVALAFGSGYAGMILSPVHVCLIVSCRYFKASLSESLRRLVPPALVIVAGATCVHLLIRFGPLW